MVTALLSLLAVMAIGFIVVFLKDYKEAQNRDEIEEGSVPAYSAIGLIVNFGDTLGIGGFAPMTSIFKQFKLVKDRIIPGTLNTAMCIPVMTQGFMFISSVEVEPVTLISMLTAATLGAVFGAGVVSKMDEKKVQLYMGLALFAVCGIMLAGKLGIMPSGGDAIGLTGMTLVFAVIGNFILGALMTLGIGLYAPCMAMVYALGMSPLVAFPIMMGSCAFLMPAASMKFIKEGAYHRKATLWGMLLGVVGVFVAVYLVTSMPTDILLWLVIGVLAYTATTMLRDSRKAVAEEGRLQEA